MSLHIVGLSKTYLVAENKSYSIRDFKLLDPSESPELFK